MTASPHRTLWLGRLTESDRNVVRDLWERLKRVPGGRRVFSRMIGMLAPYTRTIGGEVVELRRGYARVNMKDRRPLRNHLGSVHAIALANLAELTGNAALAYSLPDDARFIVAGFTIEYVKKARGTITATTECAPIESSERQEYEVPVVLSDSQGDVVARASLRSLVGPKRPTH